MVSDRGLTRIPKNRREFLGDVGRGMLLAGLGANLAGELGLGTIRAAADDQPAPLTFGALEPLVALMQDTPPSKLTEILVKKIQSGADLRTLVAAGALANARTFGGQDYVGFHTFMALAPAYRLALELPTEQQPLPVLKVLYRNAKRIQEFGGRAKEVLHAVEPLAGPTGVDAGLHLQDVVRTGDIDKADRTFAALKGVPIGEAFHHLQFAVDDEVDVHRVVLAWRGWDTMELAGPEWGHCLLRQSVRYCAQNEGQMRDRKYPTSSIRMVLPRLFDQYKLAGKPLGQNTGDVNWVRRLAATIFRGSREAAADAVAQAIQEGFSPESIGEAMSLAANMLVLHDPGRPAQWANAEKPVGSCHGDSVGVHASDAANAWRNIVRVSDARNAAAALIVGAFHTAGQSERSNPKPYPFADQLDKVQSKDPQTLLKDAETAVRAKDQFAAAAIIARYNLLGHDAAPVFALMRKFAVSEDGALHAEKYFYTTKSEYATMNPAYRGDQLVALARVTASEFGNTAAGYAEAKALLKV